MSNDKGWGSFGWGWGGENPYIKRQGSIEGQPSACQQVCWLLKWTSFNRRGIPLRTDRHNLKQECIPVGCVPPACCPYPSIHCAQGVGLPARGVYLPGGYRTPPSPWTEWLTDRCKNKTFACGGKHYNPECILYVNCVCGWVVTIVEFIRQDICS